MQAGVSTSISLKGVSADGSVIFGNFLISEGDQYYRAATWSGSDLTPLPTPAPPASGSRAISISSDGQTCLAYFNPGGNYLWRADSGPVSLSTYPDSLVLGSTLGMSGDGATLFGTYSAISPYRAWTWTAASGVRFLADLPGGTLGSQAFAISADAHTTFGRGSTATDIPLIQWHDAQAPALATGTPSWATPIASSFDGSVLIATLLSNSWRIRAGQAQSFNGPAGALRALAISHDGLRVAGTAASRAAIWDPVNGTRDLATILADSGVAVAPWVLDNAVISGDGATIAGVAHDGTAQVSAPYRVHLPALPCYPNCDGSDVYPALNVIDFFCFLNRYAAGDSYANCDGSTAPPVLNAVDFQCFLNAFSAGCP